jgi:nuclear transport factor 2 (NTF2) superfamily protein
MNAAKPSMSANPEMSTSEAKEILANFQEQWNTGNVDSILDGFADTIVVDFADLSRIEGKSALKEFIHARLARQKDYHLEKTLKGVVGSTIICSWVANWLDKKTDRAMKGRGIEIIEIRNRKCTYWEATFNAWPENGPHESVFT